MNRVSSGRSLPRILVRGSPILFLLAACGGAQQVATAPAPAPSSAIACPPCSASVAPPSSAIANADPDPPRPEDDAKASEILAASKIVVETTPVFSPDGTHVAIVATFDGRALYLAEVDGKAPPRKIAPLPSRFRRPRFSRDGKQLYFTSDREGDEAFSIFRIAIDTGAIEEMTPGEKRRRDDGPFFSKSGDRFLFSGRTMNEKGLVLFEQAATPGASATQLHADADRDVVAVRDDAKQIALVESFHQRSLWVVDLPATQPARKIFPAVDPIAKNAHVDAVAYAPDGARLFVATNDGGERTHLLALDAKTGRELARFTEARTPGGDVQGLVAAGDTIAYVVDLGTHHEVRLLDARTLKPRPAPKLALGSEVPGSKHPNSTTGLAISADGKRVAVQWSTPSAPARVFLVDTKTGDTQPLTTALRPEPAPVDARVVRIKSFDGLEIPTLVYLPKDAGKHPVVMSIHGGFPYASTARFDAWIATLVANGYAVVEPNARGSAGFGPAFERADNGVLKLNGVRDHGAVARWIAEQPWADASRMAVMGGSAGGYYTLMALSHYPEIWRAGIALVPLYDVKLAVRGMDAALKSFMETRELVPLTETGAIAALSPSTYVDRIKAPLFVYAGAKDVRTPTEQIDALVRDVRARGGKVEYMREEHAGHSTPDPKVRALQFARMLRFLHDAMP